MRAESVLDRQCIYLALAEIGTIPENLRISLNVHASTLASYSDFAGWLCSAAARHSIAVNRLTIEVIEHAPAWNKEEFLRTLEDLRGVGVKIALDDIGQGQSN